MTLAGLALAIGPLVDSAIICLENTHRHLSLGDSLHDSAFLGASEVAMPELVSSLCTFLVLAPLALMPGTGVVLFRPMAYAVAFAMIAAYILSRSFVPSMSSLVLKPHGHDGHEGPRGPIGHGVRTAWEAMIDRGIAALHPGARFRPGCTASRRSSRAWASGCLRADSGPVLRREFFPEVDAGAFEIDVRAATGTRIERTEERDQQGRADRSARRSRRTC